MRDRSIDIARGFLVIIMVYAHVLQFFGDWQLFPAIAALVDLINLTVFPTFVFCFGATAAMAYLSKPYKRALPGMLRTMLRAYAVFVLSGVGFRVLRENKPLAVGTVRRVLQLADIPGWSEFLISFALYSLLLIVLFRVFAILADRPWLALIVGAVCTALCEIVPYSQVAPTQLALFVGGTNFSYFPVVQYMGYFLAGLVYARLDAPRRWKMLPVAAICSIAGFVKFAINGGLPSRFPPDWAWIVLPAMMTAAVILLGKGLFVLNARFPVMPLNVVMDTIAQFGSRSLYYLLASNLVIFTMAGKGMMPTLSVKSVLPWTQPIQGPPGAFCWTLVLLGVLWFAASLAGRDTGRKLQ